jgi:release factor glutamine methyltransferase
MSQKTWTIQEILNVTTEFLKQKGIESSRLCSEVLLSHQLKKSRVELYLEFDQPLSSREIALYRTLVRRRLSREPLQYITGHQEFWSLDFSVSPAVLVPRPETEILVEEALKLEQGNLLPGSASGQLTLLDLGTGSGAIAVSLAKEIESAVLWASDISSEALAVARKNAKHHNVSDRITFCHGDLWQAFANSPVAFDMIISNPPYIPAEIFHTLPPEVCSYEPRIALDGRENGMHFIERIIAEGGTYLKPGGWLLIEMDPGQTDRALELIDATQSFCREERLMGYQKHYRMVKAQRKNG